MLQIVADIRVIGQKPAGCIFDEVATLSYSEGNDRTLWITQLFEHSLARLGSVQVADKRSDDPITFLIAIHLQVSV